MSYSVKEVFHTLQGEGANVGRPAVFCRFAGCNLWTGRESDRETARCSFCDTDFVGTDGDGGGKFADADELTAVLAGLWAGDRSQRFVVFTGGEPMLQLDRRLVQAVRESGFEVAVETNGTLPVCEGVDWICVSPKAGTELRQTRGNELKLVFPQDGLQPADFERLEFDQFFLQPCDGPRIQDNTRTAIEHCLAHPKWRLSTQTHKQLGIR